jgi:hypothetical protein
MIALGFDRPAGNPHCYICNAEITPANRSAEHIIPNCIGGRLKSNKLICRDCNSLFGQDIDKELCEQLNFIANRLNIKRQRRSPQPIKGESSDGSPFIWKAGEQPRRWPTVECTEVDGHRVYRIIGSAGSKELKRIISDFQKNPNAKIISDTSREERFEMGPISFPLGGKAVRSVMKMAVNLYMFEAGDRTRIEHLIPFIRDGKGTHRVSFYYPNMQGEKDFGQVLDKIFHSILVRGDRKERTLYSYIQLFDAIKCLILLDDSYAGPDIKIEYSWDVLNRKKINQSLNFSISRPQLLEMMAPHAIPEDSMRKHLSRLYYTIQILQKCRELECSFEKCSNKVLEHFPELPITANNLHVFALGSGGFLLEIYKQMLHGFVLWADPARVVDDAELATRSFLALRSTSLEIAKTICLRKYPTGTTIDRESLLAFAVELLSQMTGYMGGDEKQAMEMFVLHHKKCKNNAVAE